MIDKLNYILDNLGADVEMSLSSTCDDSGGVAEARDETPDGALEFSATTAMPRT